jgi:hypothetical protein
LDIEDNGQTVVVVESAIVAMREDEGGTAQ